ncbi:MAG: hypothetical protein NTX24_02305 [Candidatus Pacearchaeota archaeon]|nr:hypothetical protein [Candidatus Pacearchaeota archaeon]
MVIISCKECRRKISDTAESCPHCGARQKEATKKVKEYGAITIILIAILLLRIAMNLFFTVTLQTDLERWLYGATAIIYAISFFGVFLKQKWASILVIVFAIIDLILALISGGWSGLGAGVADLTLILLGYLEYKQLSKG